jgi:Arc/MetJ-type ribon-helix-helix transcriptional regulator
MARTTATFSISLPPAMVKELERIRKTEHRTRSELVREALRTYMRAADGGILRTQAAQLIEEEAMPDELEAIREGQAELRRGKFHALKPSRHGLRTARRQPRAKKS